jgi:hypothetical protein
MTDQRDEEIAELKARLAAVEKRRPQKEAAPRSGTGFSRGFFGCFGAVAAVLLVLVLLLAVSMCNSPAYDRQPGNDEATGSNYATIENTGYCVEGLHQARARGEASPTRSSLAVPWRIAGQPMGGTVRLTCAVTDDGRSAEVVVDRVCADSEAAECARFVEFRSAVR